jgi:hypothetical protein
MEHCPSAGGLLLVPAPTARALSTNATRGLGAARPLNGGRAAAVDRRRRALSGRWQPDRRRPTTADAARLAVGLVIEYRDLAGAAPGDDPLAFRADTPILAESWKERRSPSWRAAEGSDDSRRGRPTGPDHRSLPGLPIGKIGFLYRQAIGGFLAWQFSSRTLPYG